MPADFKVKAVIKAVDKASAPIRRISGVISGKLTRGLKRAGSAAKRAALAMGRLAMKAGLLGAAAAGVAAVGFLKLVDSQQRSLDSMGKLVRRSGIAIEAYQELRHAADLAGVSHEGFDKSLAKFTRNLGDAKAGVGAMTTLLKKNAPVFLEQLKNTKNVGEAFEFMVSAMGKIKDPAERASLAAAAFGRSGVEMTLILEGGVKQLRRAKQEAHELGLVLGKDATDQAEIYVDEMTRLKGSLKGLSMEIGFVLGPEMTKLAKRMKDYIVQNRKFLALKIREVFLEIVEAVKAVWNWLGAIDWAEVVKDLRKFGSTVSSLVDEIGGLKNALIELGVFMAGKFVFQIGAGLSALGGAGGAAGGFGSLLSAAGISAGGAYAAAFLLGTAALYVGIREQLKQTQDDWRQKKLNKKLSEASDALALGGGGKKAIAIHDDSGKVINDPMDQFIAGAKNRFSPGGSKKKAADLMAQPQPSLLITDPTKLAPLKINTGAGSTNAGSTDVLIRFDNPPDNMKLIKINDSDKTRTRTTVKLGKRKVAR
jgi:hypothetical protein